MIIESLEEIIGWNFFKGLPPEDKRELYPVFDTINDLIDSFHFFSNISMPSQITNYAFRDALTRVFNRHFLEEKIDFLKKNPNLFPIGLIYIDMDNLKLINDTCNHEIGDIYIRKMAKALVSSTKDTDFTIRMGGDEFLIVVLKAKDNTVGDIVNRVRKKLEFINYTSKLSPIPLSASIGWSLWKSPQEAFEKALEEADLKMYEKKGKKIHR